MKKEFMVLVKEEYIRDTQIFDVSDVLNERRKKHPKTPSMESISYIDELLEIFSVNDLDDIEGMDYRDLFSDAVLDYSVKAMSEQEAIEKVSKVFNIPPFALTAVGLKSDGMEEEALIINEISIIENQMYEDEDSEDLEWLKEEEITELADEIKNSYEFKEAMSAILNIMKSDEVIDYMKDVYKTDIDISKPKEEVDDILLEVFFDDPQGIAEGLTSAINKAIFKLYPKEKHGIGYEVAHEDYFFIIFHDVKYGTQVEITTEGVDEVIEVLARINI